MTKNNDTDNFVQEFMKILHQYYNEAESYLRNGNYESAALLYEWISIHLPDNHVISHYSAKSFQLCGNIDKSKLFYKKAYELNKDYVDYYADDLSINPFSFKKSVSIELSNLCNYSRIHHKCPLHDEKEPKVMSTNLVKKIIEELKKYGYKETIMFSVYNEPLIDPRLYYLLDYTKRQLKDTKIHVITNGFFLTQEIMDDLIEIGVNSVSVSAYSDSEYNRLKSLKSVIKYDVIRQELDSRKDIYNYPTNNKVSKIPCLMPIDSLIIRNDGSVGICCFDWKKSVVFGNVKDENLQDILVKPEYIKIIDGLRYGSPITDICKRCRIRSF